LIRFAPMVAPVMHDVNVFMHYFFVPNHLVWKNFEAFMSPPEADSILPAAPVLGSVGSQTDGKKNLLDYFGIGSSDGTVRLGDVSAIPFAAYNLIYNEYYRDQNLIDPLPFELSDGSNSDIHAQLLLPRFRSWMHDYFTSALPYA